MGFQDDQIARLESLEPRVLLSTQPILSSLFAAAQVVNVQPIGSVAVVGEIQLGGQMQAYRFDARATGIFSIDMDGLTGGMDSTLEVYRKRRDRYVRYRMNDNASAETLDSSVAMRVRSDESYYVLAGANDGTAGEYTLTFTSEPKDDHGNTADTADPLRMSSRGLGYGRGGIDFDGDVDMMRVVAPTTGPMRIDLSGLGRNADPNADISIYDASGNQLAFSDGVGSSSLSLNTVAGQTYYVRVSGQRGGAFNRYRLNLNSPIDDTGNTLQDAGYIRMNPRGRGRARGSIDFTGDVDMLKLVAPVAGRMEVDLYAAGRRNTLDPEIFVYDASGEQIAQDDDNGFGLNSRVIFDVDEAQTYYIKAASFNDATTGRYRIMINTSEPVVPPPAPDPTPEPDPQPDPPPDPPQQVDPQWPAPGDSIVAEVLSRTEGLQLRVIGTNSDDVITISQSGSYMTLVTGPFSQTFTGTFVGLEVYGFDGADTIRLTNTVSVSSSIYAGAGNDTVFEAGGGAASIDAGAGDDLIVSVGGGSDSLLGGAGFDSFWFDSSDSVGDASSAETAAGSVHSIAEFYQPYTTNPASGQYVSLEIAGQDLADPTATGYASGWSNFADVPLFVDGPQYDDIKQGAVGDCYYLAVLAGLAESDPMIVRQMITPFGDGTYGVRFYNNGQEVYLRVDADLPVNSAGSLVYARKGPDGELWVPLAEKAYAYFRYGQNSYASISGGWMTTVFRQITGGWTNTRFTGGSPVDLYNYFSSHLSQGHSVTIGSNYNAQSPVVGSHAYVVMSVHTSGQQRYVTIYNTWGWDGRTWDSNRYDGLLTLSIQQIQENFSAVGTSLA